MADHRGVHGTPFRGVVGLAAWAIYNYARLDAIAFEAGFQMEDVPARRLLNWLHLTRLRHTKDKDRRAVDVAMWAPDAPPSHEEPSRKGRRPPSWWGGTAAAAAEAEDVIRHLNGR